MPRPARHGRRDPATRRLRRGVRSTLRVYRTTPAIRVRAAYDAQGFACFSTFWVTAAFGLLCAAGALAANRTGRVKRHTHPMPTLFAVALIALAYAALLVAGRP
ncbi:hypothetical protein [Streptomyces sp. NPDC051001]|uniref:hypothetical protein n=1 Tax=Streptomyces sp. NPDC051001 TaxID=3155795 RepID=UPI0034188070